MCCAINKVFKWILRIVCLCLIVAAVVGAVTVFKKQKDADWSKLAKSAPAFVLLIVVMVVAVVSGLLGLILACCCDCFLILYMIILVACIIFEIVVIAVSSKLKNETMKLLNESWALADFTDARKAYEAHFKCCGYKQYPSIICGYEDRDIFKTPKCDKFISDDIDKSYKDLTTVTIIVLIVQVILFILSIITVCCCKKSKVGASESTEEL